MKISCGVGLLMQKRMGAGLLVHPTGMVFDTGHCGCKVENVSNINQVE